MKVKEVLNDQGKQYHINCTTGDVGKYVLLPGDPFRTDMLAEKLENATLIAHNREHKTWTGYLDGEKVSITSTGMGGPSASIALEELINCGADTFIRIGTCGRVSEESMDQSLIGVVVSGAIRDEGTSRQYIPIEYPAIANREIVSALADSATDLGYHFGEGIVHCKDSFYGQHDPDSFPNSVELNERWEIWKAGNTMASEMETAAILTVGSIRRVRTGAILAYKKMNDKTIAVTFDAIRKLIAADKIN